MYVGACPRSISAAENKVCTSCSYVDEVRENVFLHFVVNNNDNNTLVPHLSRRAWTGSGDSGEIAQTI